MKTKLLLRALPALLLSPTLLLAQGGTYTVRGQLGPKTPPTKAYLFYRLADKTGNLDSVNVVKGRFTFKGTVAAPTSASLFVTKPGTRQTDYRFIANARIFTLYLEPGTVKVSSPDSLLHATLAGTPLNADRGRLLVLTRPTEERKYVLSQERFAASPAQRQDKASEASLDQRRAAIAADEKVLFAQFIRSNSQSLVSLDVLRQLASYDFNPADLGPLFEGLAPAVRQSADGQAFAIRLDRVRKSAIGAVAPDFTQNDPNGKPVKLSDFRGKYVLVDFWASWCGPCRRENPNVVANYHKYKDRNFTVLGISLDQPSGRDAWLKVIDTDGLTWTQVSDLKGWKNDAAQLYDINAIPQNLLIGPDGRIVAKNVRGEELGQKLATLP